MAAPTTTPAGDDASMWDPRKPWCGTIRQVENQYVWTNKDQERERLARQVTCYVVRRKACSELPAPGRVPRCLMYELTGAVYNGVAVLEHMTTLMRGSRACWPPTASLPRKLIDIDTFAERISVECGPDPVLISGPDVAVWARKPYPRFPVTPKSTFRRGSPSSSLQNVDLGILSYPR
jgi:hypothetical protein